MKITIEYLQAKRKEYEKAYTEHLGIANANYGAMEAVDKMILDLQSNSNLEVEKDAD